jgi:glycogen synthase
LIVKVWGFGESMNRLRAIRNSVLKAFRLDPDLRGAREDAENTCLESSAQPRRLLYLAGSGNALDLFRQELNGRDERQELAIPYSRQVLDVAEKLGADVLMIVERSDRRRLNHGRVRIEEHPIPFNQSRGPVYHFGRICFALKIAWIAWYFRPQVVLASTAGHWFTLAILSWMKIKIITSLHNTFWPREHPPAGRVKNTILKLNGWFWHRHVTGTIAVSDECARQVRAVSPNSTAPVRVVVAQYPSDLPPQILPPQESSFRVLFMGRVERVKGVWDVFAAAQSLDKTYPGRFYWTIAGVGEELESLREAVTAAGLESSVLLPGHLAPQELIRQIDAHHVVVSPTTSGFSEGLQKVALEGILRGRPVITTVFSNAFDRFGSALTLCEAQNPDSIAAAVLHLADNPKSYERARVESLRLSQVFFNRGEGYGEAIQNMLEPLLK